MFDRTDGEAKIGSVVRAEENHDVRVEKVEMVPHVLKNCLRECCRRCKDGGITTDVANFA